MYRGKLKDGSQIAVKCVRKVRDLKSRHISALFTQHAKLNCFAGSIDLV
jgi:hypothetical protein